MTTELKNGLLCHVQCQQEIVLNQIMCESSFVLAGCKRFRTFGMMKYLKNHFIE